MAATMWLTDRSRYETGLSFCQRARYLQYHWGPSASGVTRQAQAVPLATGSYVHQGLAWALQYAMLRDALPPDAVVREGIAKALAAYDQVIALRGLSLGETDRLEVIVAEQQALVEGLIWAFVLTTLPWILEQARVVQVEHDDTAVLGCTCGLGDLIGTLGEHEARDCEGIGFQYRLDFLTEYRARPGVLAYWEFKTVGSTGERWETQWETMPQVSLGALMESRKREQAIQEAYVVGLIKGRREGDTWNPETKKREGDYRQQSVLCYGWHRPANLPLEEEDWQVEYDYKDEGGRNHRRGKAYQKQGIWTLKDRAGAVSVSECWCKWMDLQVLGKQVQLVGPLQVNPTITSEILEELVAEEQRWKGIVWALYQVLEAHGFDWTSPAYQAELRRLVPRSWSCRRYGKAHQCQFVPICFAHEGWETPLEHGFIPRRPHHDAEMAQLAARGLLPPEGWAEDEEVD